MGDLFRLLLECAKCLNTGRAIADDRYAFVLTVCRFIPMARMENLAFKVVESRDRGFKGCAEKSVGMPCMRDRGAHFCVPTAPIRMSH